MGYISRLITFFGLILLAHAYVDPIINNQPSHQPSPSQALPNQTNRTMNMEVIFANERKIFSGYSAHEHTVLYSNARVSSASTALPHDIAIEALVSLVVVSVGLVLGAEKLKPISWSEWAGQIEREGGARNPYRRLEERYGFWDVRVSSLSLPLFVPGLRILYVGKLGSRRLADFYVGKAEAVCGLDSDGGSPEEVRGYEANLSIWS